MIQQASDPSKLGFDPDRLARFRPWMQRWVDQGKYPGAQVLIARRGEVAFRDCVGLCDLEAGRPWQQDTLVRIYSMTKPVASVALLMLYEDALCHLDTPVDEFLPELADRQVLVSGAVAIDQVQPAGTRLTLHHLLTHTSGFTYGFNEGLLPKAMRDRGVNFSDKTGDLAAMVGKLSALPLAFEPGRRWNYGVSTDVIGRVVEVISGRPLDRFLAERIFEP
ncbi:MAG: serine hydrolase domain-containing protein, partial [Kiloniellales bacterium]|nr:serine hydrolase domain-containing protein [Kiloniellales bacterium]